MYLYISKLQFDAIHSMQAMLAEEYGLKHPNLGFYLPIAFIDTNIEFVFEDAKPVGLYYKHVQYGNFSITTENKVEYLIPMIDMNFLIANPNIKIVYSKHDSGIETETILILHSKTNKLIKDLSIADGSFIYEPQQELTEEMKALLFT